MRDDEATGAAGKQEPVREATGGFGRREFLKLGGIAGLAAGVTLTTNGHAQVTGTMPKPAVAAAPPMPVVDVTALAKVEVGQPISFFYPDETSPAVLVRLAAAAEGGIGPNNSIVAFSALCTHKGCPVSFKPGRSLLLCGCHWSSFDPAKGGRMIIGQASEPLPQISLRIAGDVVQAFGVNGLIYGRHTNIK